MTGCGDSSKRTTWVRQKTEKKSKYTRKTKTKNICTRKVENDKNTAEQATERWEETRKEGWKEGRLEGKKEGLKEGRRDKMSGRRSRPPDRVQTLQQPTLLRPGCCCILHTRKIRHVRPYQTHPCTVSSQQIDLYHVSAPYVSWERSVSRAHKPAT